MLRALWLAEEDQEALRDAAAILADQADNMVTASRKRLGELPFMRGRSDRDVTPSIRAETSGMCTSSARNPGAG